MQKRRIKEFLKQLSLHLTEKAFLKKIRTSRKAMTEALSREEVRYGLAQCLLREEICCEEVLQAVLPVMRETVLDPAETAAEPEDGWLRTAYSFSIWNLFPESACGEDGTPFFLKDFPGEIFPCGRAGDGAKASWNADGGDTGGILSSAVVRGLSIFLETLHVFFEQERNNRPFSRTLDFSLLSEEESGNCRISSEYLRFLSFWRNNYIYELMRISGEVTPFNTLGHIAGVHFTAMHVARQLSEAGAPVDIALVSAAAAGHDLGKYGCSREEAGRVPYLHYYYSDLCLKRADLPLIAHIAANHSTWDLELENLSAESLILIYADFRVKSSRNAEGKEEVHFYSLSESYDVILSKLDNVDEAKKHRYQRVYAKLKDFEDYMIRLGVETELENRQRRPVESKDPALRNREETIQGIKDAAIAHNLSVMSLFNQETAFGNLLEAARTERQWKSTRAYINILKEYSAYLTQRQKQMTLRFLYEQLMHREGDIRRQAADLMGEILAGYDEIHRKEIPRGVRWNSNGMDSQMLWRKYLAEIIFPDYQITDQHKRWLGYTLKYVLEAMLRSTEAKGETLEGFLQFLGDDQFRDAEVFVLLDTIHSVPLDDCQEEQIAEMLDFVRRQGGRPVQEIRAAALRFLQYAAQENPSPLLREKILSALKACITDEDELAAGHLEIAYLREKIYAALGEGTDSPTVVQYLCELCKNGDAVSELFLENFKVATPWITKAVNIELLLDLLRTGASKETLHIATHFSNLVKVSERVTVRHRAGKGLLEVIQRLPLDQRNEVVIEMTKGLEIGEYQFSKYIPEYLGEMALYLHPEQLDELLGDLLRMMSSTNEKVASVTLDTIGILVLNYPGYQGRFEESDGAYRRRQARMLGALMKGLAGYNPVVRQEAFLVLGQILFGAEKLSLQEKNEIFQIVGKKMFTLLAEQGEGGLSFFNDAAALNHIYRFIADYLISFGSFSGEKIRKIAFFPGTFDPFTLGHKGIAAAIRDLGFEVYLAVDEFSWSKKTQPHMLRRKIITMSVAEEEHVYVFPDDIPVNIANSQDMMRLKGVFPDQEVYLVVGSDVLLNASSYQGAATPGSVHHFNHVVFRRESGMHAPGAKSIENLNEIHDLRETEEDTIQPAVRQQKATERQNGMKGENGQQENWRYEDSRPENGQQENWRHENSKPENGQQDNWRHENSEPENGQQKEKEQEALENALSRITGKVVVLSLPTHLEDISSTQIRDNIDNHRDISNLIDTTAQNFIAERGLYLREPQYKTVVQTKSLHFEGLKRRLLSDFSSFLEELEGGGRHGAVIRAHFRRKEVRSLLIRDGESRGGNGNGNETGSGNRVIALAAVHEVDSAHLYQEFKNAGMAEYLRQNATGKIAVIGGIYISRNSSVPRLEQMILTEVLADCLKEDFFYAVYYNPDGTPIRRGVEEALELQGFRKLQWSDHRNRDGLSSQIVSFPGTTEMDGEKEKTGTRDTQEYYVVDMRRPVALLQNMATTLKAPFDRNERIIAVMDEAHKNLQRSLTELFPGNLVLSFDAGVMHHKLIQMITRENGVPEEPLAVRSLGPYMCVPFGKILKGMVVPNTVTKTVHTEKSFRSDLSGFRIEEVPYYASIANQMKTIRSFRRPVILVDDLLHKGYRMRELDRHLKEEEIEVEKIVVGILSGSGRDLMTIQGRKADSAYFLPNLRVWFVESTIYPFIGGDGVRRDQENREGYLPAINLILPYAAPGFLRDAPRKAVYDLSMTCLKNTRNILLALEEEYQLQFERKLTLKRLSEAVIAPRFPDLGQGTAFDESQACSEYLLNAMERLQRLRGAMV